MRLMNAIVSCGLRVTWLRDTRENRWNVARRGKGGGHFDRNANKTSRNKRNGLPLSMSLVSRGWIPRDEHADLSQTIDRYK